MGDDCHPVANLCIIYIHRVHLQLKPAAPNLKAFGAIATLVASNMTSKRSCPRQIRTQPNDSDITKQKEQLPHQKEHPQQATQLCTACCLPSTNDVAEGRSRLQTTKDNMG